MTSRIAIRGRRFFALVARELLDWRWGLLAALVLGLVPLFGPLVPAAAHHRPDDVRGAAALVLAGLATAIAVLVLGSTLVARDLSERRLGFHLSRPVAIAELWTAKWLAGLGATLAVLVLILLPAVASSPTILADLAAAPGKHLAAAATAVAALAAALLLCHAASVALRARSAWIFADMAGLALVVAVGGSAVDALLREQALGPLKRASLAGFVWTALAAFLAGYLQLAGGRVDLGRGHRRLTLVLWPLLLAGVAALSGYARFILSPEIDDLVFQTSNFSRAGWEVRSGPTRTEDGYRASFLLDPRSGRSLRLGAEPIARNTIELSPQGRVAVWLRCADLRTSTCPAWTVRLDEPGPLSPRETRIEVGEILSPNLLLRPGDDGRLALYQKGHVEVWDLASERQVAVFEEDPPLDLALAAPDRLWLLRRDGREHAEIVEIDVASRRRLAIHRLADPMVLWRLDPVGRRLISFPVPGREARVYDLETGDLLELREGWSNLSHMHFLDDGRVIVSEQETDQLEDWLAGD